MIVMAAFSGLSKRNYILKNSVETEKENEIEDETEDETKDEIEDEDENENENEDENEAIVISTNGEIAYE